MRNLGPNTLSFQTFEQRKTARRVRLYSEGAPAEAMRASGFTNHELDLKFKRNRAQLLKLPKQRPFGQAFVTAFCLSGKSHLVLKVWTALTFKP